jgi:hypothetical protein
MLQPRAAVVRTGVPDGVGAYAIVGTRSGLLRLAGQATRSSSRFVGRAREMAVLEDRWAQARGGDGQVVGIVGDPGVGKSRLSAEFIHACEPHGARLLETRTTAYSQEALYRPIGDLLRGYFGIEDGNNAPIIREKVSQRLASVDIAIELVLFPLLTLLDVSIEDPTWQALEPTLRRQRILEAILHVLLHDSQVQPLVLVCEDLHWGPYSNGHNPVVPGPARRSTGTPGAGAATLSALDPSRPDALFFWVDLGMACRA